MKNQITIICILLFSIYYSYGQLTVPLLVVEKVSDITLQVPDSTVGKIKILNGQLYLKEYANQMYTNTNPISYLTLDEAGNVTTTNTTVGWNHRASQNIHLGDHWLSSNGLTNGIAFDSLNQLRLNTGNGIMNLQVNTDPGGLNLTLSGEYSTEHTGRTSLNINPGNESTVAFVNLRNNKTKDEGGAARFGVRDNYTIINAVPNINEQGVDNVGIEIDPQNIKEGGKFQVGFNGFFGIDSNPLKVPFTITEQGNVGIGTTTPIYTLESTGPIVSIASDVIYVDPTAEDDLGDGLSQASAKKTLGAAFNLIDKMSINRVTIQIINSSQSNPATISVPFNLHGKTVSFTSNNVFIDWDNGENFISRSVLLFEGYPYSINITSNYLFYQIKGDLNITNHNSENLFVFTKSNSRVTRYAHYGKIRLQNTYNKMMFNVASDSITGCMLGNTPSPITASKLVKISANINTNRVEWEEQEESIKFFSLNIESQDTIYLGYNPSLSDSLFLPKGTYTYMGNIQLSELDGKLSNGKIRWAIAEPNSQPRFGIISGSLTYNTHHPHSQSKLSGTHTILGGLTLQNDTWISLKVHYNYNANRYHVISDGQEEGKIIFTKLN